MGISNQMPAWIPAFAGMARGGLVWYEHYDDISEAIMREKQIKGWTREKKISLIRAMNPGLKDLSDDLM